MHQTYFRTLLTACLCIFVKRIHFKKMLVREDEINTIQMFVGFLMSLAYKSDVYAFNYNNVER